jgi:drug/metabolite transporter (DMT)-like permease
MTTSQPVRKAHMDTLAVGLLLVCCMFWGFHQVLVKATLEHLPPVFQAAVRSVAATVLLLLWCHWRGLRWWQRDGSFWVGLLAGCLFSAEFALVYSGLRSTSASRMTVFLYTAPFWVAVLVPWLIPSERLRPLQWLGLACAFVAVAFALREGLAGTTSLGDALALGAGAMWGLTTVTIRISGLSRIAPEKLLLYQLACSAVVLSALSWGLGESWSQPWSGFAIGSMATQTVVGAFASYLIWMWMLGRYPATKLSVFVFLTPLFALLFGNLWLGEAVTLTMALALGLVALGIVLVNYRPSADATPTQPGS